MQRATGLDARWVDADEVRALIPAMADGAGSAAAPTWRPTAGSIHRGTCAPTRSRCSASASSCASAWRSPVCAPAPVAAGGASSPASRPPPARSRPGACCSPGARRCRRWRRPPARRAWVGYARHQVVVTEPSEALQPDDDRDGVRHRRRHLLASRGGRLPLGHVEPRPRNPGPGRAIDWRYLRRMERRLHRLVPATEGLGMKKVWAATIEYTPDHLPLAGPLVHARRRRGRGRVDRERVRPRHDVGPGRLADRGRPHARGRDRRGRARRSGSAWTGSTSEGRSPFVDPVALPFPVRVDE